MLTLRGASKVSHIGRATLSTAIHRGDLKATKKQWEQKGNVTWCYEIEEVELKRYAEGVAKRGFSKRKHKDSGWAREHSREIIDYFKQGNSKTATMNHFSIDEYGLSAAAQVENTPEAGYPSMLVRLNTREKIDVSETLHSDKHNKLLTCEFCGAEVSRTEKFAHILNEHPEIKASKLIYKGGRSRAFVCSLCSPRDGGGTVGSFGALYKHYLKVHPDIMETRPTSEVCTTTRDNEPNEIKPNGNTFYANLTAFLREFEQNKLLLSELGKENEALTEKLNNCNLEREKYQRKIIDMQRIMSRGD